MPSVTAMCRNGFFVSIVHVSDHLRDSCGEYFVLMNQHVSEVFNDVLQSVEELGVENSSRLTVKLTSTLRKIPAPQ